MSYGFKFKNDKSTPELIIDDSNVKPWLYTGSYIGLNYETTQNTTDFNQITDRPFFHSYSDRTDTQWNVYEVKYVAPSGVNSFVAFKLPDTASLDVWYSPGVGGPYITTSSIQTYIPQAGSYYPTTSIFVMISQGTLLSITQEQILGLLPTPYFFATDAVFNPGTGYGVQVFKENSQCMFDSNKKHIKLNDYSFAYMQVNNFADFVGPVFPGTMSKLAYNISGSTGSNLAFILPEGKTDRFSSSGIMYQSRIWYQKSGNTLYNLNQDANSYTVSPLSYGYSNLVSGSRYNINTETLQNFYNYSDGSQWQYTTLYQRALILDIAGFDAPYTATEFPAGYSLSKNLDAGDDVEYQDLRDKFFTEIVLTTTTLSNGTQVPYTITGSGITASDFKYAYDLYRPGQTISDPINGYFTINSNKGVLDFVFNDDAIIEGTETMTLSLNNGKGSISVQIKERKNYVLEWITQPDSSNAFNEGDTVQFRLTTKNVTSSEFPQWALIANQNTDFNANDVTSYSLTGGWSNLTQTGSVITAIGSFTLRNDITTEGLEKFVITLTGISQQIAYLAASVNDTSAPVSYSLRYGTQTTGSIFANEGDTLTFTIVGQNVPNGTRVYPGYSPLFGTVSVDDIDLDSVASWYTPSEGLKGVVMQNNLATFSFKIKEDQLTEGTESINLKVWSTPDNQDSSKIIAQWDYGVGGMIYINDTSRSVGYTISTYNNVSAVNEGGYVQIDINADRYSGNVIYWRLDGVDTNDINYINEIQWDGENYNWVGISIATTGSFIIDGSLTKSYQIGIRNDYTFEGTETMAFSVRTGSSNGNIAASKNITIYDTSIPTATVYNDTPFDLIGEGQTIRWNIYTQGIPNGTYLYWNNIGNTNAADFNDIYSPYDQGSVLIMYNAGWFERTLKNDMTTEGDETITMQIRYGSNSGTLLTTAQTVYAIDTSTSPTATIYPSATSVNEGGTVRWNIETTNIPNGTYLYWTNQGTTTAADFNDVYGNTNYGSVLIMYNAGWFERTLTNDVTIEGYETIIMRLDIGGNLSNYLATATAVAVNDSSVPTFNEIVTVTPSSVQYPNGVTFRITNGRPNDIYYYSINNQNYDNQLTLDGNGYTSSADGAAATGFAAGSYTVYVYFANTGHFRQASWTVTAAYPAAGTYQGQFCQVGTYDLYTIYANGSGGTYNQLAQANAPGCGYVAPSGPQTSNYSLSYEDPYIEAYGLPGTSYDGLRCRGMGRTGIDVYVSRTFYLNQAATITGYLHVSSELNYDFGEMYFDGVLYARGSGTYESGAISGPISAGYHTVKCRYTTDYSINSGTDSAFVEYVIS